MLCWHALLVFWLVKPNKTAISTKMDVIILKHLKQYSVIFTNFNTQKRKQKCHGTVIAYKIRIMKAEKRAVNGSVTNQANTILLNSFKSTSLVLLVLAKPTNTTEPTLQCVVLIGRPNLDAIRTVVADPISIVNPLNKN